MRRHTLGADAQAAQAAIKAISCLGATRTAACPACAPPSAHLALLPAPHGDKLDGLDAGRQRHGHGLGGGDLRGVDWGCRSCVGSSERMKRCALQRRWKQQVASSCQARRHARAGRQERLFAQARMLKTPSRALAAARRPPRPAPAPPLSPARACSWPLTAGCAARWAPTPVPRPPPAPWAA